VHRCPPTPAVFNATIIRYDSKFNELPKVARRWTEDQIYHKIIGGHLTGRPRGETGQNTRWIVSIFRECNSVTKMHTKMPVAGIAAAVLLLTVNAVTGSAWAASFPCAMASTPVERTICGDPVLSEADDRMAALYRRLLALTSSAEDVKNEQRRWLTVERNATADAGALRAL
jgi:uncharacterized protein YecT (DUF1311 family)